MKHVLHGLAWGLTGASPHFLHGLWMTLSDDAKLFVEIGAVTTVTLLAAIYDAAGGRR